MILWLKEYMRGTMSLCSTSLFMQISYKILLFSEAAQWTLTCLHTHSCCYTSPGNFPTHNQYFPADNLQSQLGLTKINGWTLNQKMMIDEQTSWAEQSHT